MGKLVKQTSTRLGRLDIMCQNPYNAVLCCGHSKGIVTMWTPNVETSVAKMLCHRQPIRAVAVDPRGVYMATAAVDASVKIWDVRTYKCLQSYKIGSGASHLTFSQRGLLAVSLGNIVEVTTFHYFFF
jgi:U3 small nucleolar RNA-associated protein 7